MDSRLSTGILIIFWSFTLALSSNAAAGTANPRSLSPYLEKTYAQVRHNLVSNIDYDLQFSLLKDTAFFSGKTTITFDFTGDKSSPLTLDFAGGDITRMTINGKLCQAERNDWFLTIPHQALKIGENTLVIDYTHLYSTTDQGLVKYQDPKDHQTYIHSNFEPYGAHLLFPAFDQPDLKAKFRLKVTAPKNWQVISAARARLITDAGDNRIWWFNATDPIAPYAFSLHAGDYQMWTTDYKGMPLRLFARHKIAKHVDAEEWFVFTKQALDFYSDYFGIPFPFDKYDQILVPEFNVGAMENVAATTFRENLTGNGQQSYFSRMRLNNVISHEIAHMWFGNLVTMSWWDGLWLNESFATYMSTLQQAANSEFKSNAWEVFNTETKQWAYDADQKPLSHPVAMPIRNTAEAETVFDGITYAKGAALLHSLSLSMGEEKFRKGLSAYLQRYKFTNATTSDFFDELQKAATLSLTGWVSSWLKTAGVNELTVTAECRKSDNRDIATKLVITQYAKEWSPELRKQHIRIGLFTVRESPTTTRLTSGTAALEKIIIGVTYKGPRTELALAQQQPCPDFIYPNLDESAYVIPVLDADSRHFLLNNIQLFEETLRPKMWKSLWNDVSDRDLSLATFINTLDEKIDQEHVPRNIHRMLSHLVTANNYLLKTGARDATGNSAEQIIARQLARNDLSDEFKKIIFPYYVMVASDPKSLTLLRGYLDGKNIPQWLSLTPPLRWQIVTLLNKNAYGDYLALTAREQVKNNSLFGKAMANVSQASRPDIAVKRKWLKAISAKNSDYSYATLLRTMWGLFPPEQIALQQKLENDIEQGLPQIVAFADKQFIGIYIGALLRGGCTRQAEKANAALLAKFHTAGAAVEKPLTSIIEDTRRCVRMKENLTPAVAAQ